MLITVMALVFALAAIAAVMFVAVVVSIHREPSYRELTSQPSGPVVAIVRRLLGVYVQRSADAEANESREECLTGHSVDWWTEDGEGR
jgi:hypothetical protein